MFVTAWCLVSVVGGMIKTHNGIRFKWRARRASLTLTVCRVAQSDRQLQFRSGRGRGEWSGDAGYLYR